ncbi:hypothetical protein [Paraburkholderia sp.]|uniref:hypothetical protein n=1 Tax=Paraburkholderia sp. TaxID=1926495 RepID=UPI00238B7D76|nr:hypothetical protein [Paraburkholderia sp.]MDE1182355.1 hypothetical protein [Paraburkholderia sp.]
MRTTSESHGWTWRRAASALTQVCVVTDGTVPDPFEHALSAQFAQSAQVSLLHLDDPHAAHREWIAAHEPRRERCAIERALAPLPPSSRLLLCSQDIAALEWLGGVVGQKVCFVHWRPDANPAAHATQLALAIDAVEDALRASLAEKFGDSY